MIRIRFELAPEMRDVNAQIALRIAERLAPHLVEELPMRERAPVVRHELVQQIPLGGREMHGGAGATHVSPREIDLEIVDANGHVAARHRPHARAPQLRPDARAQLRHTEGLRHVVVRARIEQPRLLFLGMPRGQHEDRRSRPFAHRAAKIDAIHVRQAEVEHDQLRARLEGGADSFGASGRFDDVDTIRRECVAEQCANLRPHRRR